jgi:dTMP kinase
MTTRRGKLIVLEGAEGVGKTTQLRRLGDTMTARGIAYLGVREPGGTAVGNEIRRLLLEPGRDIRARTEALLFMASRAQLIETEIGPALDHGKVVLADRFFLSTYAYQIAGRGLSDAEVTAANRFATGGLGPDLTILLRLSVPAALARTDNRGSRDRIEAADDEFHHRVADAFDRFAEPSWQQRHPECGPVVAVDAAGSVDQVAAAVLTVLEQKWPETFRPAVGSHP